MPSEVTRFAPSPTGYLHLGHAYAAIFAAQLAYNSGGRFLVRIEDTDTTRSKLEFEHAIGEDLSWLGLTWEQPMRRQSEHFDDYVRTLERLKQTGAAYPCFCTRREIEAEFAASVGAPQGPDGPLYAGTCRTLSGSERERRLQNGMQHAWRIDIARASTLISSKLSFEERGAGPRGESGVIEVRGDVYGDFVLARKDAPASYHVAVVTDDALQGITTVTRGNDLFSSTHIHRVLQQLLGLPSPRYMHHRLITDSAGKRLAKRDQSTSLRELRAQGVTAAQIYDRLGLPVVQPKE